jgi:catechol 2,3-dioxygenase-like lactoylglutathione lyase family enzyme
VDMRLEVVVLPVSDPDRARDFYQALGYEVFHDATGVFHHDGTRARVPGPAEDHKTYGSWVSFSDPNWPDWYAQYMADESAGQAAGS